MLALLTLLAPVAALAAFSDPFYQSSFRPPDTIAEWAINAGNWQFAQGELRSSAAGLSIATVPTYDPAEFPKLIRPILEGRADVVYGSRFLTGMAHRVLFFWHSVANRVLTFLSNMITNLNLTDMETCYKVFRGEVARAIRIQEDRFGFEPEITAKVARLRCRIYEVGISYDGRSYAEGKKLGWTDGVWAIVCLVRYGLFHRPAKDIDAIYAESEAAKAKDRSLSSPYVS